MDEQTKKSGIKASTVILVAVLVAIVFGGGAYAYVNNKAEKEKKDLNAQITELQSQVSSATAGWKTYTDSSVGFTFKYPSDASLSDPAIKKDLGLTYRVQINNLSTMEDGPLGYDKATALKDKAALASGDPSTSFGQAGPATLKMLSIKNALAKELTISAQIEVCSVEFNRQAIIYKDDYQIILSWEYAGTDIQNNNPSYFKTDSKNCGSQKIWGSSMYADLVAGKTDAVSQNWFTDFDKIISTFQFTK